MNNEISRNELRERAALNTFARFGHPGQSAPLKTVRPIEDVCAECQQREPDTDSKYCRWCKEMTALRSSHTSDKRKVAVLGAVLLAIAALAVVVSR